MEKQTAPDSTPQPEPSPALPDSPSRPAEANPPAPTSAPVDTDGGATPPPAAASAAAARPSFSGPRRADRVFITGATGTGKTVLARRLYESFRPPRLVIDPKADQAATGGAYADRRQAITFTNPAKLPDAEAIRFVPRDPMDLDAYDRLARSIWDRPGLVVWIDEAGLVLPALGAPRGMVRLVTQGRSRRIGLLALHQRPVEVARTLIGNAEHVATFRLGARADVETIAGNIGMSAASLAAALTRLPPHGFAWYARREHALALCPPIPPRSP